MTFPFLLLTRELRDNIYDSLLVSTRVTPSSPEDAGARKFPKEEDEEAFERCNKYPAENLESTNTSLSLVCRQICNEMREAVLRLKTLRQLPYKLDILFQDERELYPTWLSFPALVDEIPRLEVELRLLGDVEGKISELRGGCGGPPIIIWALFYLTRRFLLRGPDFLAPLKRNRDQRIDELAINIVTPTPPPANGFTGLPGGGGSNPLGRKGLIEPGQLVNFLSSHMGFLLRRTRHTESYARFVFARVKRMSFSLDGAMRESWDLSRLKPEWPPNATE